MTFAPSKRELFCKTDSNPNVSIGSHGHVLIPRISSAQAGPERSGTPRSAGPDLWLRETIRPGAEYHSGPACAPFGHTCASKPTRLLNTTANATAPTIPAANAVMNTAFGPAVIQITAPRIGANITAVLRADQYKPVAAVF